MKKLTFLLIVVGIIFTACEKGDNESGMSNVVIPSDELHYTSIDGLPIDFSEEAFDAPMISNTYTPDGCVIKFATPLKSIGSFLGSGASENLTTITFPSSLENIVDNPFSKCVRLGRFAGKFASADGLYIAKGDKFIALAVNSRIEKFDIPNHITSIGKSAFQDCKYLTSVTMNGNVVEILDYAFSDCSNLKSISLSQNITNMGERVFYGCTSLEQLTMPDKLTYIPVGLCQCCSSLMRVTLPSNLEVSQPTYRGSKFLECYKLEQFVGNNACHNGQLVVVNNILDVAALKIKECVIPENVQEIQTYAFEHCRDLQTVTIPNGCTKINNGVFSDCTSLKTIYCKATTPPVLEDGFGATSVFYNHRNDLIIYVPRASVNAYKNADKWKSYASYIAGYNF